MTNLTILDLNTEVNHEPRIADLRLAEFLGFARTRDIRKLIERHKDALEKLGGVCATVARTSAKGGRPTTIYHLNKKQCIFLTTKSDTEAATEKTIEVVEVYDAYTKSTLTPSNSPVQPQLAPSRTLPMQKDVRAIKDAVDIIGHAMEEINELEMHLKHKLSTHTSFVQYIVDLKHRTADVQKRLQSATAVLGREIRFSPARVELVGNSKRLGACA